MSWPLVPSVSHFNIVMAGPATLPHGYSGHTGKQEANNSAKLSQLIKYNGVVEIICLSRAGSENIMAVLRIRIPDPTHISESLITIFLG